jgi:hypothetical protein
MDIVQSDAFTDDGKIVATFVPEHFRLGFLPRHFGFKAVQVEDAVYGHMDRLCPRYAGGYWEFFDLSNRGCYLAPNRGAYPLVAPNGFEATVSAGVAGLIASLYAFSHLAFKFETAEVFSDRFHQLREFALEHPEAYVILAAID